MVLTVSFVVSPESRACCLRRLRGVSGRLGPTSPFRKLDTSVGVSGRHDFAVRPAPFVIRRMSVHRIPRPTFVTIAKRPSKGRGTGANMVLIWGWMKAENFCDKDWT